MERSSRQANSTSFSRGEQGASAEEYVGVEALPCEAIPCSPSLYCSSLLPLAPRSILNHHSPITHARHMGSYKYTGLDLFGWLYRKQLIHCLWMA